MRNDGSVQPYPLSRQGIAAIIDYLDRERKEDQEKWQSHALFLAAIVSPHGDGRLNQKGINTVWNQVRDFAGVDKDKIPHSARYCMGVFIMDENRQCGGGATPVGPQKRLLFHAVFAHNQ